jgi:hypothetical protein
MAVWITVLGAKKTFRSCPKRGQLTGKSTDFEPSHNTRATQHSWMVMWRTMAILVTVIRRKQRTFLGAVPQEQTEKQKNGI